MRLNAPYFVILLCLMPNDFTCQGESAATQWVNLQKFLWDNKLSKIFHHIFVLWPCVHQGILPVNGFYYDVFLVSRMMAVREPKMKATMSLSKAEPKRLEHFVESSVVRDLAWFYPSI
jgi:hypothetical protein